MAEYERSIEVNAPADRILDYVSDVNNLPGFLPTLQRAEPAGGGKVRMEGDAKGHPYQTTGFMRVDRAANAMEWGSDEDDHYRGRMTISEDGGRSRITVRVQYKGTPPMLRHGLEQESAMDDGLANALQSIKNHLEGTGGKVEAA